VRNFIVTSVLIMAACIAVISYEIGYQNGALSAESDATLMSLMAGGK
jgi:hypothetical protein